MSSPLSVEESVFAMLADCHDVYRSIQANLNGRRVCVNVCSGPMAATALYGLTAGLVLPRRLNLVA